MSGLRGNFDCIVGIDVSKDKFDACGITGCSGSKESGQMRD